MEETPGQHLYRSVVLTGISRFKAAQRLQLHSELSTWSISAISFSLIVAAVMTRDLSTGHEFLSKLQIVFSFLTLILSVSLSGYRFGTRSEKMHECGVELNALARLVEEKIYNGQLEDKKESIEEFRERYEALLRSYENHTVNDYHRAKYSRFREIYNLTKTDYWIYLAEFHVKFIHYYLMIVLSLVSTVYIILYL